MNVSGLCEIGVCWSQRLLSFTLSGLVLSQTIKGQVSPELSTLLRLPFVYREPLLATDSFVVCALGGFSHLPVQTLWGGGYSSQEIASESIWSKTKCGDLYRRTDAPAFKTHSASIQDPAGGLMVQKSSTLVQLWSSVSMAVNYMSNRWHQKMAPVDLRLLTLKTLPLSWVDGLSIRLRRLCYYLLYPSLPQDAPLSCYFTSSWCLYPAIFPSMIASHAVFCLGMWQVVSRLPNLLLFPVMRPPVYISFKQQAPFQDGSVHSSLSH